MKLRNYQQHWITHSGTLPPSPELRADLRAPAASPGGTRPGMSRQSAAAADRTGVQGRFPILEALGAALAGAAAIFTGARWNRLPPVRWQPTHICAWCKMELAWTLRASAAPVSHGICPDCFAKMAAETDHDCVNAAPAGRI